MPKHPDVVDASPSSQQHSIAVLYSGRRRGQSMDMTMTIEAARGGDETAFGHLVVYYRSAAERVAQHILKTEEAAADAVQDAFIKVYKAMQRFQDGNFRSWLLRIVTNTCYDHLRREKRRHALSLDELSEQPKLNVISHPVFFSDEEKSTDPEFQAICRESMDNLLKTIDQLPPWHRNVVMLVDVHGYDYAEAAELLGLPLGTIKSRLSRARAALRQEWVELRLESST